MSRSGCFAARMFLSLARQRCWTSPQLHVERLARSPHPLKPPPCLQVLLEQGKVLARDGGLLVPFPVQEVLSAAQIGHRLAEGLPVQIRGANIGEQFPDEG